MRKEVTKAVEVFRNIAFKNIEEKKCFAESQIGVFLSIFTELLLVRYEKFWFPEEPDRASGYRCIRVNGQSFDPVVAKSLTRAGVPPEKHRKVIGGEFTVWVDPGVVSMRIGEDGSVGQDIVDEELYNANLTRRRSSTPKAKAASSPSPRDSPDEGLGGSRSPSPRGLAASTDSNVPSFRQSPPQEYNPYTMSSQVYNRQRLLPSPPTQQQLVSPQHRTLSPPTSTYASLTTHATQRLSRPMMPQGRLAPASNGSMPPVSSGHIPVSAPSHLSGPSHFPSARRNVFGEGLGLLAQDSYQGKMAASQFSMGMSYQGNPSFGYMDIPIMA